MKYSIRHGVFETNSSSIHSLAIPKVTKIPSHLSFNIGDFGWEFASVSPCDYIYTAIYAVSFKPEEAKQRLNKLIAALEDNHIEYDLGPVSYFKPEWSSEEFYLDNGYVDHAHNLTSFVDSLLDDPDKLIRFLSGGLVFTGNDNSEKPGYFYRDEPYVEDYNVDEHRWVMTDKVNPYYMPNYAEYDWFRKGN